MNPRIYKKQAKRAVQLLRSHGGWPNVEEVFTTNRWEHPQSGPEGIGIDGCPVFWRSYHTDCGTEWDAYCPRGEWMECHYWAKCVPEGYFKSGDEPYPKMTQQQKRERFNRDQINVGWRWRGGRAVRIEGGAA